MKYQLIVLFGPPGCGKGTQAALLDTKNGYSQLGMSKLLTEFTDKKKGKSALERVERIKEEFKSGGLVGFDDVVSIMEASFSDHLIEGRRMTLDGFPRTANQSLWLSGLIVKEKVKTLLIHFDLELRTVLSRIENRWFVEGSNDIFSSKEAAQKAFPDKTPFQRGLDQDPDIIRKRFAEQYGNEKLEIIKGLANNPFVDVIHLDASLAVTTLEDIINKKLIY
jgi:adenylate kinase